MTARRQRRTHARTRRFGQNSEGSYPVTIWHSDDKGRSSATTLLTRQTACLTLHTCPLFEPNEGETLALLRHLVPHHTHGVDLASGTERCSQQVLGGTVRQVSNEDTSFVIKLATARCTNTIRFENVKVVSPLCHAQQNVPCGQLRLIRAPHTRSSRPMYQSREL